MPTPTPACAATATPTPSPTQPPPSPSPGCSVYPRLDNINNPPLVAVPGPTPGDGTTLQWRIFSPDGSGPWPAILLVHGGRFLEGDPRGGAIETIAQQLVAAGYYVAIPTYRLAAPGLITNQVCHDPSVDPDGLSGRPPEQSDDVEAEVIALRGDSHCTGKVGVVGGSAGGSWAVWAAFDTNPSGGVYPFWHSTDRPECAVSLSGAYQFDDRAPVDYGSDIIRKFAGDIENYTGTNIPSQQHSVSPVTLVTSSANPVFLINSIHDAMPYPQILDMICVLEDAGLSEANGDFKTLTVPGDGHSFDNWFNWDGIVPVGSDPSHTVSYHILLFLDAHLK